MKKYIGILSVVSALAVAIMLTITQEAPSKVAEAPHPYGVKVREVRFQTVNDVVTGHGQVSARWQTSLTSEIGGRILSVSDQLLVGAKFSRGDVLATVETTPYRAALANAQAALATSLRVLQEEELRAKIAIENWESSGFTTRPTDLVMRKPQLLEAQANIMSSEMAVAKARYDLAQTRIIAPYDGVVLERAISPGDILQAGTRIGRIYDRSVFEVRVPLADAEINRLGLDIIDLPVEITTDANQRKWRGKVARVEQSVDIKNRWKNIIVEVSETTGLVPGMFVTVNIPGKQYDNLIVLPERFVGPDHTVWFVDQQNLLHKFAADIVFSRDGEFFIRPSPDFQANTRITPHQNIYLAGVKVAPVAVTSVDDLEARR